MNKPIDLSSHPILQQAFDVIQAIEKCGASVELTSAVTKAGKLMTAINELIAIRELKGDQVPVTLDADMIRDANRYRFLRDEDAWGEDSDSWDFETRTGLISWGNLCGVRTGDFDAAVDARMAASDIPFLNPATAPQKQVLVGFLFVVKATGQVIYSTAASDIGGAQLIGPIYGDLVIEAAGGIVKEEE